MKNKIIVVIPSFKVKKHIIDVIDSVKKLVDLIIIVDDKCPENSGRVAQELNIPQLKVIFNQKNLGVGGAVKEGYKKAIELGADIVIKIDGDGQMDSRFIPELIKPIVDGNADYTKGNRFRDFKALRSMPKLRLLGNSGLSFLIKIASGYWNIIDPTNGYTAIKMETLKKLDLEKIDDRYFFESDMLVNLNLVDAVVQDVSIPAKYENENSSLSIAKTLFQFPPKIFKRMMKRIFLKYFIYDFNMASIYTLLGVPMFIWGFCFGAYRWYLGAFMNIENSTGTVMLSALPLILSVQFLTAAINIDINNVPKK